MESVNQFEAMLCSLDREAFVLVILISGSLLQVLLVCLFFYLLCVHLQLIQVLQSRCFVNCNHEFTSGESSLSLLERTSKTACRPRIPHVSRSGCNFKVVIEIAYDKTTGHIPLVFREQYMT